MMLRERIKQTLEKRNDIDQRRLARIAGLSESSISRYLHGYEEANFESVLKIVKYLFPREEVEIMAEYVTTQKSRNARHGLEYCVMNRLWDEVDVLIDLLSVSTNPLDKEWATMYDLLRMKKENFLPPIELLQKVEEFKPKEPEMRILKSILKGYLYFDMDEHTALSLHIDGTDSLIKDLKSTFIRDSFYVRLGMLMGVVYLYANNLEESRRFSYAILGQDFFEHVKSSAYNTLGQSYMFEDYQKAENYFVKALDHTKRFNQDSFYKITNLNLSFLYSFWGIEWEYTDGIENQRNLLNFIFYCIKKDELVLAKEYLNTIDIEKLTEWDKAFYYYYSGLLTDDINTYYQSVELFVVMGNYFYMQLPLLELQRLGENESALKIISYKRKGNLYEKASKNFTCK